MAPQLQPLSLYRLCLSSASQLIDQSCTNIFLENGSYGNQDCVNAIQELQSYLTTLLPLTVFEHLSEDRNSTTRNHNPLIYWSKDPRIKLGLFLHPSIRKFVVDNKGNELMLSQPHDDITSTSAVGSLANNSGLDDFFWCAHIRRLVNLVYLNLNLITTDEILFLVGKFCLKLEIINIVSRIKQDYIQQDPLPAVGEEVAGGADAPGGGGGGIAAIQPLPNIFPGIALRFCVSDFGLESLLNCQFLRKITMNKITNHSGMPTNRGISLDGVGKLVQGLPYLEIISFGSMGKILQNSAFNEEKPLKLVHYYELDPEFVQVDRLQRLCPNLAHINLSVPITINPSGNIDANANGTPCVDILNALAVSNLPLRIVELQHFPYCDAFEKFLRNKGSKLQELLFRAINNLNSKHLLFIGSHCKMLQKLHIKELGPEDELQNHGTSMLLKMELFTQLHTLHLSGRGWNSKVILPLVLMSATQISKLSLMNMSSRLLMDPAWTRILASNSLKCLSSLSLYSGCFVSIAIVKKLTLDCPKLSFFSFIQSENIQLTEVERLRLEVSRKNLNIKLCCLEMFDV